MIARGLANPLSPPHLCDWVFETLMTNPGHSLFATVLPLRSTRTRPKERSKNGRNSINMNTQMGSSLPSEKLDWSNYSSWEYKMNQFLVHQGHWSYNKAAKAQNRERTKPRRHKAAKAQNRAKPRRNKATKAQSHQGAKPRKATKATKSRREDAKKAAQQSRTSRATAQ